MKRYVAIAVVAALAGACGEDFAPFNELDKLRVLAVRAAPPELAPGEATVLDALVYEPDGEPVSYAWSWCPLTLGAAAGFECAIGEAELAAAAEEILPGAGALVPSYDLGDGPTAAFAYAVPPGLLAGLCDAIAAASAPSFVALPECGDRLVLTIRLDVVAGGEAVAAVKELPLLFAAPDVPNANPVLGGVFAAPAAGGGDPLVDGVELDPEAPAAFAADTRYDLVAEVEQASSQSFTPAASQADPEPGPRYETLFLTWFVTGGETEAIRTGFVDGDPSFDDLERNSWRTPEAAASDGAARLYLVLQDERGGVAWSWRDVALGGE